MDIGELDLGAIGALAPTICIYNEDAYARHTKARVLYVDGRYAIFDRSIFYAEGGGQIADTGLVDGARVIDVQKECGEILHPSSSLIELPSVRANPRLIHEFEQGVPFSVGDLVDMELDYERRYKIMRLHSLSHFFYEALDDVLASRDDAPLRDHSVHGSASSIVLKGAVITDKKATFSLGNDIDEDLFSRAKARMQRYIDESPSPIVMERDKEIKELFYFKNGGLIIPCGGTHVRDIDEIRGKYIYTKKRRGKNSSRLSIAFA